MFAQALSRVTLAKPAFPVISNVTAQAVGDQQKIRQLLVEQITSPVRWEPSMRNLTEAGAEVFVEFPPARVLTALLRRIDNTRKAITVDEPQHFTKLSEHLGLSLTL